jgi:sodium/bile acid cotransporter 7
MNFAAIGRQWFLLMLVVALAVGFLLWRQLQWLNDAIWLRNYLVFSVMLAMALPLELKSLVATLKKPIAPLVAFAINFGLVSLLCWFASWGFDFATAAGMIAVGATPCTLASASVWTRKAGGNDAVAIFVTVLTNGLCFAVTPFLVWLYLGSVHEIDAGPLMLKLLLLVVLPIVLAQVCRASATIARWATSQKTPLGVYAQVGILMIVVIGAVKTATISDQGVTYVSFGTVALLMVSMLTVHVVALLFGYYFGKVLKFDRATAIAMGISGSQKTLMVGLSICLELEFSVLPMIIYHAGQLLADTIFANRVRSAGEPSQR